LTNVPADKQAIEHARSASALIIQLQQNLGVRQHTKLFMKCRLCGHERALIDAHIIPKPFFIGQKAVGQSAKVLSNLPGQYPKRLPIGVYDSTILCASCDSSLGRWDEYGVSLLLRGLSEFAPLSPGPDPIAFVRPTFDYGRLKLFWMSVLWRAGEASHDLFRKVRLGPYAGRLREMLLAEDPGDTDEFTTLLSAFTVEGRIPEGGAPIMDPFVERWDRVRAYRLSAGVITAYIKVDHARFRESFRRSALKPNAPLVILTREFGTSSEADVARAVVAEPLNKRAFKRPPRDA
jgi:hypothetical protein